MRAAAAQLAAHLEPIRARQHHVEHDDVVLGDRRPIERVLAVRGDVDGVRLLTQSLRQQLRGTRFVLNQQHSHQVGTLRTRSNGNPAASESPRRSFVA